MSKDYLRLFVKRKWTLVMLSALLLFQLFQLTQGIRMENGVYEYLSLRRIQEYCLLFVPVFCFWNAPAYTWCSETNRMLRYGSPFRAAIQYLRFSLINTLLYVLASNLVTLAWIFATEGSASWFRYILILLLFQLILYLNCSLLYFLVMTGFHQRIFFGFLAVVLYAVWDLIGEIPSLYGRWFSISTSYVASAPEALVSPPVLIVHLLILAGTGAVLLSAGMLVSERTDCLAERKEP